MRYRDAYERRLWNSREACDISCDIVLHRVTPLCRIAYFRKAKKIAYLRPILGIFAGQTYLRASRGLERSAIRGTVRS